MNLRAVIVLLIALAGCGAGVAAQMNDQWHIIDIQWDVDDDGVSNNGQVTITYGLEEAEYASETCYNEDCESDSETEKMSKIFEDCDDDEDQEQVDDCNAAVSATTNTTYVMNGIFGWGLFAVLSSIFAIIGISGNKFAGFFTLMLSLLLFGAAIYHIMTFPELGDTWAEQDENLEVTEYPGQATWILGGGGILTLIGSVIGFRGGEKDGGSTEPETGGSYYHGDWGS